MGSEVRLLDTLFHVGAWSQNLICHLLIIYFGANYSLRHNFLIFIYKMNVIIPALLSPRENPRKLSMCMRWEQPALWVKVEFGVKETLLLSL